jgi:TPR repeat protein
MRKAARAARANRRAGGRRTPGEGIAYGAAAALFATVAAASVWSADFDLAIRLANEGKYALAYREFQSLVDEGDPRGHNGLGVLLANGLGVERDDKQAARWFREGADRGFATAQFYLGQMYQDGRGVGRDYAEAMRWYRLAAEQGDMDARTNIGQLYAGGYGVPRSYDQAMAWYRKAAEAGDVRAQASIGDLYRVGEGVPRDYIMAYAWYGIAAAGGYGPAPALRDDVATFLTSVEVEQGRALARDLYRKYGKSE